jgi:hypothetical protein
MKQFVVLAGGLGNQLFQIASALSVTDKKVWVVTCFGAPKRHVGKVEISDLDFGERIVFLDCTHSHMLSKKAYMALLSLATTRQRLFKKPYAKGLMLTVISLVLSFHLRSLIFPRVSIGVGYDSSFINRRGNLFAGYFQTYKVRETARVIIIDALDKYAKAHLKESGHSVDLVIHSRLGDYKNDPLFGTVDKKYFLKCLEILGHRLEMQKIGLFSDEPDLALQQFPKEYRGLINVMEASGDSPLLVLLKMRAAKNYILSNSTFGWWAAFTSAPENVFVPSPWFNEGENPQDLFPESWVKVDKN